MACGRGVGEGGVAGPEMMACGVECLRKWQERLEWGRGGGELGGRV